jgi:hypothetical protein
VERSIVVTVEPAWKGVKPSSMQAWLILLFTKVWKEANMKLIGRIFKAITGWLDYFFAIGDLEGIGKWNK